MSTLRQRDIEGAIAVSEAKTVDPKLLEVLVCPTTKTPLEQELISRRAGLVYPIRDGVPIMLPEEARALDDTADRSVQP